MRTVIPALLIGLTMNAANAREVKPELSDEVIFNPGTGWQMLVTDIRQVERGVEEMPLVSTYYYRSSWTRYEPQREQYDGSPAVRTIDRMRDLVREKGKYFAFRVVTYNAGNPTYQRTGQQVNGCDTAVPAYIYTDLGAKGFEEPGGKKNWVPVFWDPVYIQQFNKLGTWLGKRYAGDPNLAYVDIGGGNWGEMNLTNTGIPELDNLSKWREHGLTPDSWHNMLVKHIAAYRAAFPAERIILARDYASYGKGAETTDYGLKQKIGFRDDGLGMDYSRAGRRNTEFMNHWDEVPCLFENGYIDWTDTSGAGWGSEERVRSTLEWAINECHACIVMVGKGDGAFRAYRTFENLVKEYGKKVGYRLAVTAASVQDPATVGSTWRTTLVWQNLGNSPPYEDYALEIALVRGAKTYFREILPAEKVRTSTWAPGGPVNMALSFRLPAGMPTGKFALTVALCRPDKQDDPLFRINLAHKTADQFKRALVDYIEVKGGLVSHGVGEEGGEGAAEGGSSASYPEIEKLLQGNEYGKALDAIEKERKAGGDEAALKRLAQWARDGNTLIETVSKSGDALKGQRISVDYAGMRTRGRVASASDEGLEVSVVGDAVRLRYAEVRSSMLASLAGKVMEDTPANHLLLGRFLASAGEADEAREELKKVPEGSAEAEEAQEILKRLK